MQKTLTPLGNSLALVIDKPLRAVLGISRETVLEITTDGRRIVIEPMKPIDVLAAKPALGLELDAPRVFRLLLDKYDLHEQHFRQLHEGHPRMTRYRAWVEGGWARNANPMEQRNMHRFAACLDALKAGRSWPEAIADALAAHPKQEPLVSSGA